jgi:hypothetical protein
VTAGFRSVFLLFGLAAGVAVVPPPPPPPPPVVEVLQDATPGPLTPAHIARLRGAPPWRPAPDAADTLEAPGHAPRGGEGDPGHGAGRGQPAPDLPALLATARAADPGPDWARVLTLAVLDTQRRQAQAQAAADEEALVLMLVLGEVL